MAEEKTNIEKLKEWVRSDEFALLVDAYPYNFLTGTTGTQSKHDPKPEAIHKHGVLKPERFTQYMLELQRRVLACVTGDEPNLSPSPHDRTLRLLQSTLEQMIGSVNFSKEFFGNSKKTRAELFEQGKEMGRVLRAVLDEQKIPALDTGRGIAGKK